MISIISCSIHPKQFEALRLSVIHTIGDTEVEFLPFDNRGKNIGICEVYNTQAEKAKGDVLCFVHEDIVFLSEGWGRIIEEKFREKNVGVIGFSGSQVKSGSYSCVHGEHKYRMDHYTNSDGTHLSNYSGNDFVPVVTLDGMCLFVKHSEWQKHKFDQEILDGFHGYDMDFSLQFAHHGYTNYICYKINVQHLSRGCFEKQWASTIIKLHNDKWNKRLPLYAINLSFSEKDRIEREAYFLFIKTLLRSSYSFRKTISHVRSYRRKRGVDKYCMKLYSKIIFNRLLRIKR